MMADVGITNRAMFWRIIRRLFGANPGRLFVMLLALGAGAALTAALLNLQLDAKRRLTTEFSVFGPNVLVMPRDVGSTSSPVATMDQSIIKRVPFSWEGSRVHGSAYLFLIADASSVRSKEEQSVVVAGIHGVAADDLAVTTKTDRLPPDKQLCIVGHQVVNLMHLQVRDHLMLRRAEIQEPCQIAFVALGGAAEDSQIRPSLDVAQRLAGLPGRISLIQLRVPGTAQQIDRFIAALQQQLPDTDVKPIRQFTEGEAKIYNRISGLLTAAVAIILLLTGLCVMAAMTNVAMERKMDVGLMKAIGGSMRRVLRLFLAEAALLGLAGGMVGAAAGIFLSIGLGKAVFGMAARPRLIVYPVAVALTVVVAILSAFPLRRLASIRPASVFRGEA
jgi:ABC-type lipoprotein release transport system permease subunit